MKDKCFTGERSGRVVKRGRRVGKEGYYIGSPGLYHAASISEEVLRCLEAQGKKKAIRKLLTKDMSAARRGGAHACLQ